MADDEACDGISYACQAANAREAIRLAHEIAEAAGELYSVQAQVMAGDMNEDDMVAATNRLHALLAKYRGT